MTLRQIAERYGLTSDGVDFALSQYQIVICEITHGMMSKLSYYAKDIIQVAQERWCDTCDLKALSGWISVKDRLPEKEGQYLCWFGKNTMAIGAAIATYLEMWKAFGSLESLETYPNVTHWMPLPEPPKEGDGE